MIRYESRVAATIIGMLGQCGEAEDVGQETFMRFYKSLTRFKGESSVGTYLIRIAINLSINELKRRQRRNRLFHTSTGPGIEMESFPSGPSAANPSPEQEERKILVRQALQKLEPRFRVVIVLRLIDGYSTREAAQILKLPTGTVLSRLARAQKKLKKILGPALSSGERYLDGERSLFSQANPSGVSTPAGKGLIKPLVQVVTVEEKNESR